MILLRSMGCQAIIAYSPTAIPHFPTHSMHMRTEKLKKKTKTKQFSVHSTLELEKENL